MIKDDVKTLLGIQDDERDGLIDLIVRLTSSRLNMLLGASETPPELDFVVTEVSVIRFNKIGSEGSVSHSAGSESLSFSDDDFASYMSEIRAYQAAKGQRRLRFL